MVRKEDQTQKVSTGSNEPETENIETKIKDKVSTLEKAFKQMRNEELGIGDTLDDEENVKMINALAEFVDWSVSCSLKDPTTRHLVLEFNKHKHFTKSCRKKGPDCKYGFPRFPTTKTIIAVPSRILFKDDDVKEKEMISKSNDIKSKMKTVLKDVDIMKVAENHREDEIDLHLRNHKNVEEIEFILEFKNYKKSKSKVIFNPEVSQALLNDTGMDIDALKNASKEELIKLQNKFNSKMLTEKEMDTIREERLDILLQAAGIEGESFEERNMNYVEALSISLKGYSVILKRDVDEIMINNYNSEWIKSWSGNMDMQVCLDFYAIITYITDYYMKDESGTMRVINEALANSSNENLKQKMNIVKNAFLTSRQAGECEIYYKMLPFLHLSHSNIGTEFIHTGFRKNRSRFLKQITEGTKISSSKIIQVEGKEGNIYMEKEGAIEKYMRRPSCFNISFSQFVKRYAPVRKVSKKYNVKQFYIDIGKPDDYYDEKCNYSVESDSLESEEEDEGDIGNFEKLEAINEDDIVFEGREFDNENSTVLPPFIPLETGSGTGEFKWMKKRSQKAIRFHKFNKTKDPHQWYFSELLLYLPFKKEEELFPDNLESCIALYVSKYDIISRTREQVMPYLKTVSEARERAEEFLSNIGDEMDPTKEQLEEEHRAEGVKEHPDLNVKDPSMFLDDGLSESNKTFRSIELQSDSEMSTKLRSLDADQRAVVDKMYNYAVQFSLAQKKKDNPWPKPPLLMVHGGAGTGKSHVIDCVSQLVEKVFRTPGDDPSHPYVLKLAFTGNAASIIKGQTIHSAFQLPFGNKHVTLNDKTRDLRRKQLHNLRLIILDEVSLIKADMLYQIHFRLLEIFQNRLDFGNVAVLALGDILQIKPPLGTMIYDSPLNEKSASLWRIPGGNLWEKFEVITLKTNHRQGENLIYANILNRIRIGKHSDEDIDLLRTRVFPRNSKELPTNALLITGENKIVKRVNDKKLNETPGDLIEIEAEVTSRTRGSFKPKVDKGGQIKNTPLPYMLRLKKNARVMLTMNLDVCDSLSNGALGEIIDFKINTHGEIQYVLVKFDNDIVGEQYRKQLNFDINYPGQRVTAIKKVEFEFQLREGSASSATAINFPLKLAWATTCHKIQVICYIIFIKNLDTMY